jgi:hypothetical protein
MKYFCAKEVRWISDDVYWCQHALLLKFVQTDISICKGSHIMQSIGSVAATCNVIHIGGAGNI